MVTAEFLVKGAMYALEQCGLLLHDARRLYEAGSYATTVVLAAFAREELGRSKLLRDMFQKSVESKTSFSIKDIRAACAKHEKKQEMSQYAIVLQGSGDDRIARLVKATMEREPSPKGIEAVRELQKLAQQVRRKKPVIRHMLRQQALYVEPTNAGNGWNQPKALTKDEALRFLADAANDYSTARENMLFLKNQDAKFAAVLAGWKDCPDFPRDILAAWEQEPR